MQLFSNDSLLVAAAYMSASGAMDKFNDLLESVAHAQGYEKIEEFCSQMVVEPDSQLDQYIYDELMSADETDGVWAKLIDLQALYDEGIKYGYKANKATTTATDFLAAEMANVRSN